MARNAAAVSVVKKGLPVPPAQITITPWSTKATDIAHNCGLGIVQRIERGVWLRPFGKLVYTMPPYVIEDDQLDRLTAGMCRVVADYLAAA